MKVTIEKTKDGNHILPFPDELIEDWNLRSSDRVEILQRKHDILVIPLPQKTIKNREDEDTPQLYDLVDEDFREVKVTSVSQFYLDYAVDEETYNIDPLIKEKVFTSEQVEQNLKAFKEAYIDAKDGKYCSEIMEISI